MESNYTRSMLVSERCYRLSSNFTCALYTADLRSILIMVCAGGIDFLTGYTYICNIHVYTYKLQPISENT